MASTVLDPTAVLIKNVLAALVLTPAIKAYRWEPGMTGMDALPAAVVGLPTVVRADVEGPESQLGSRDWQITYPVSIYFDLPDATSASVQAAEYVEAFIRQVDTGTLTTSDATIIDAKVTTSEPVEILDEARPMVAYDCSVELLKLVPCP